jgi:Transposase DDE domain
VSIATTLNRSKGGQFIAHAKALPGNPYDGHTLATVIPEIETQIGASLARIVADRGYRGHNAPPGHKFRVYISGQRRRVTETIKPELRRRSAVEPVIGHAKAEHRMGRNYLVGTHGDAANAVLAAAGYNFRRLLEWLALLLSAILAALKTAATQQAPFKLGPRAFFSSSEATNRRCIDRHDAPCAANVVTFFVASHTRYLLSARFRYRVWRTSCPVALGYADRTKKPTRGTPA